MKQTKLKNIDDTKPGNEKDVEDLTNKISDIRDHIEEVVFGQKNVIDLIIITLLSGGHTLLVGLPGLAKTRLVRSLGTIMGLSRKRVQFTPDLMPTDILGTEILEETAKGKRSFRFLEGPVFAQFLLADEINRASPRTQSALLQAMQERRVTVAGTSYDLPEPFHVLATQNPIEQEGTYPLPEAQLDRFLMQIDIKYPEESFEKEILLATTGVDDKQVKQILSAKQLINAQKLVRAIPVGEQVVESILKLVRNSRPNSSELKNVKEGLLWGAGPRASQSLMIACRAKAIIDGRLAPSIDDVLELAAPVLKHRLNLTFSARAEGITVENIIEDIKKLI